MDTALPTLRTPQNEARYREVRASGLLDKGCVLCTMETVIVFKYWKIVPNQFPYDKIAVKHDMIVSLRHVEEKELTDAEKTELLELKENYLKEHYQFFIEASQKAKSIPEHFHLHLVVVKDM
jgi:predicted nucleic acid-binding OB-fold protein